MTLQIPEQVDPAKDVWSLERVMEWAKKRLKTNNIAPGTAIQFFNAAFRGKKVLSLSAATEMPTGTTGVFYGIVLAKTGENTFRVRIDGGRCTEEDSPAECIEKTIHRYQVSSGEVSIEVSSYDFELPMTAAIVFIARVDEWRGMKRLRIQNPDDYKVIGNPLADDAWQEVKDVIGDGIPEDMWVEEYLPTLYEEYGEVIYEIDEKLVRKDGKVYLPEQ